MSAGTRPGLETRERIREQVMWAITAPSRRLMRSVDVCPVCQHHEECRRCPHIGGQLPDTQGGAVALALAVVLECECGLERRDQ